MKSYRFWLVAASASTFLATALSVGVGDALGAGGTGGYGGEGGTTNGLLPEAYHHTQIELDQFMRTPTSSIFMEQQYQALYDRARDAGIRAGEAAGTPYTNQGERLLKDVIGCALRTGSKLPVNHSFAGEGLMTPGANVLAPWKPVPFDWPGNAPDDTAVVERMEDIHTCLIARLNAFATPVLVFLSGAHVTPPAPGPLDFLYDEAVWLATEGDHGRLQFDVWPLQQLETSCNFNIDLLKAVLQKRICGTLAGAAACGLTVHQHSDLFNSCMPLDHGVWWCKPTGGRTLKPAVATRIGACAWSAIYGSSACSTPWGAPHSQAPVKCDGTSSLHP